jgi:hypothetical protein
LILSSRDLYVTAAAYTNHILYSTYSEGEMKYNNLLQSVDENLLQNFHNRVSKGLGN